MSSLQYTSKDLEAAATSTYFAYDIFVYVTFAFKPFVIVFFGYHFYKKSSNICNIFFYLLFVGFCVDLIAWILVIADGFCWDYSTNASVQCWYIDVIFVPYSHYNNSFSSFWLLLLSFNRLTAVLSYSTYDKFWSPSLCKFSFIFLFLSPFAIIGYSFINYKCRFYLGCNDPNFWVTFGTVSAIGNGTLSVISFGIAIITAAIYRSKKFSSSIKNSDDVKLIFQSGATSFICIIHYIAYAIAEKFRAYKIANPEYRYDLDYVIINTFQFMAYPGYHFSAFFYLFVFSSKLRRQFLELYHLTWLYKIFCCCAQTQTRVIRIGQNPSPNATTTISHGMTKSAVSTLN